MGDVKHVLLDSRGQVEYIVLSIAAYKGPPFFCKPGADKWHADGADDTKYESAEQLQKAFEDAAANCPSTGESTRHWVPVPLTCARNEHMPRNERTGAPGRA